MSHNSEHLLIAVLAGVINMVLSVVVPCLLKSSNQPFLVSVKKVFQTNRNLILLSSITVGIMVYLALALAPSAKSLVESLSPRKSQVPRMVEELVGGGLRNFALL